jgi:hypothetical protein
MNLFWTILGNMTAVQRLESVHRFKTLPLRVGAAARFRGCEDDFAGTRAESFSLREIRHDVSLIRFAAPTALETSAV